MEKTEEIVAEAQRLLGRYVTVEYGDESFTGTLERADDEFIAVDWGFAAAPAVVTNIYETEPTPYVDSINLGSSYYEEDGRNEHDPTL